MSRGDDTATGMVAQVVAAVRRGAAYRDLDAGLVHRVAAAELGKGRGFKEAVKATRNKLHQVAGAYWGARVEFDAWLAALVAAPEEERRAVLRTLLAQHASTRERLPFVESFYATVLGDLPPIRTLVDLACGLNPLAWPWMPLAPGAVYHALDVYGQQAVFLNRVLALGGLVGRAGTWDLLAGAPPVRAEVALLLKAISCLEQLDKGIAGRLVDEIAAPVVVVSYPLRSLGGRAKGMAESYARHFDALAAGRAWRVTRFDFPTELVYRIER